MGMDDHTVIGRALAIIEVTLGADGPISLADLSRLTRIPKPTVRRMAINLTGRGLLTKEDDGYRAGPQLDVLGARAAERQDIRRISTPPLQELFQRSGGVVWLIELKQFEQLALVSAVFDRSSLPYSNDWPRNLHNASIMATALGQVVLADHPDRVEVHLQHGIPRLTPRTVTQPGRLLGAIARAIGEGLAVEHEQVRLGWSCLAVPIKGPDSASAVLGVVDRTSRFNPSRIRRAAMTTAADIGLEWRGAGQC